MNPEPQARKWSDKQTTVNLNGKQNETGQATGTLQLEIIRTIDDFDKLEVAWQNLSEASATTSIFQTYQWNRTWWKYFGKRGDLYLVHFKKGESSIAIAPFFRDRVEWAGKEWYHALRFIGSNVSQPIGQPLLGLLSYTDYLDLLILPGYETEVLNRLADLLAELQTEIDEILLESVPSTSLLLQELSSRLKQKGIHVETTPCSTHQQVELPGNWDEYLATLSKNSRYHARRALKKIEVPDRRLFTVHQAQTLSDIEFHFEEMVRLHQNRWNRLGSLGTFAENRNLQFHREVVQHFYKMGWIQLNILSPVEEPDSVAIDLNYHYKGKLFGIHCTVDDESEYYQAGPGTSLIYHTLKSAMIEGCLHYDFLRGEEPYKQVLANRTQITQNISIRRTASSRLSRLELVRTWVMWKRRLYRMWLQNRMIFSMRPARQALTEMARIHLAKVRKSL